MKDIKKSIFMKFKNQWVALDPHRKDGVIASSKSIKELEDKLTKLKIKDASLMFITPPDQFLTPVCQ